MNQQFKMVAKTFQGLEDILAQELRGLGASDIRPGRRVVEFEGDLEMLYKANLCCRTALRILKPVAAFHAENTDELYEYSKDFNWGSLMSVDSTFSIDTVAYSDHFPHSRYVTYRVKDAIVDWFQDRYGEGKRPGVRLDDADVRINVHISGTEVTLLLDSSGESLHKRGYRVAQTEAPINEVLAAGIILKSGWRGDSPLVDPMCGSGTFLIEAALIAANINPGIFRKHYAFENWKDFDAELFDRLYNDDSAERPFDYKIYGADISPKAVEIASRNIRSAGVARMIDLQVKPLSAWDEAPENGVLVTNPPYGERISVEDMEGLYQLIGSKLKNIFKGYHAWIIASKNEYVAKIGLSPSQRIEMYNGAIECELREYVIFEGDYKSFRRQGGKLREAASPDEKPSRPAARKPLGGKRPERKPFDQKAFTGHRYDDRDKPSALRERKKEGKPSFRDGRPDSNDIRSTADRRRERREFFAKAPRNKLEERYHPGKNRSSQSSFRPGAPGAGKSFTSSHDHSKPKASAKPQLPQEPSDNPLAVRRNEEALKSLTNKQPSLPAMRSRRKKEDD